eukprot:jgi/Tetstr1/449455/TSEL_036550.t1
MWLRLAEGLLPAYDQPQPCEAAADQPAATPADVLALAGVRAWAEYEADTDADDAVICPPTRTLLALMEFFRCALTAKAICTGPPANLELPTVEQLAEAIAATITQRTNTSPELHHAQWLTDTMTGVGVEMHHCHTEPTLLRVGDNNLCVISLGKEDEEFADTLRMAVALTSPVALLRAIRLRWIVIYLTESKFDPSLTAHHHNIFGGTRSTDRTEQWPNRTTSSSDPSSPDRTPATAPAAIATTGAHADDDEDLDLNYEEMDNAMEEDTAQAKLASHAAETHQLLNPQRLFIQLERHPSQPTPASKGKTATTVKLKKKKPRGRSRSDGATRNRNRSKPRLSGTRGSDSEWETDDDADQPSSSSH